MPKRGVTLRDVAAQDFIEAYSKYLKKSGNIELPKWVDICKTTHGKELPPANADWFYVRIAALARKVYLNSGKNIGTKQYKKSFGSVARRGSLPNLNITGSGAILRAAFKQLTKLKVVELDTKGGRKITSTGQRDLDRIAAQIQSKANQQAQLA
eukprot:TRINITY_DN15125_c0_g1_i1.p1 TRINITY_DN15125_c0_g1~~TRINITY_DN15125_c0_g1_i1.p1  ORF type:complete len:154 (-),score=62.09 TRINITY_DN15125_c0_g1_i1:262-723(-)